MGEKTVTVNRKAGHDYHIVRTLDAGISLLGTEIKSVRDGRVSIQRDMQSAGTTVVPLRLFLKDGMAKLEIALGRGKKSYDKREAIAKREAERRMQRALRRQA